MVTNYRRTPSVWAWNFVGFGLMCFLIGAGWSIAQAKYYKAQLAEHKLVVGKVLLDVEQVSDTLSESVKTSAITPQKKYEIQKLTEKSSAVPLEQVKADFEEETDKLINLEN